MKKQIKALKNCQKIECPESDEEILDEKAKRKIDKYISNNAPWQTVVYGVLVQRAIKGQEEKMNQIIKDMNKGIQELDAGKLLELGNQLSNQNASMILDKVIELTLIFCRELLSPIV